MSLREPDHSIDQLAHRVIGAAIEVHKTLGPGFLESVYEEALCIELGLKQIPFERQKVINVAYKGYSVGESRLDLLELKAVEAILPIHTAQVLSYLKATGFHVGLLINFKVSILKQGIKRIVLS